MTNSFRFSVPAFFHLGAVGALLLSASPARAAWEEGVKYGGNTIMHLYTPTQVDASPGIVVALHYCSGNAGSAHSWFQALADKHGFLIIAPGAGGNCFDASPSRSGERDAIAKMVAYVVAQKNADAKKVFAAGASSGACMTQALLAAYPEVFAAGSVLAGVPAGAWTGGNAYGWSTPSRSAAQWGDIVRNASASFTGTRPRVQLWHGTADSTLTYSQNFPAEVLQWTNVLGVTDANATKSSFKAQDTWARNSYKDASGIEVLETNVADGAPHDLSGRGLWPDVVRFFGLDVDGGGSGGAGGSGGVGGAGGGTSAAGAGGKPNGGAGAASTTGGAGGTTSGTAGSTSSGGAVVAGGSTNSSAGSPSSGGAPSTSAGASNAGGKPGGVAGSSTAGSAGAPSDDGGCSVGTVSAERQSRVALVGLLVAGLAAVVRRRRSAT
jgi:acetylxylan esterase